MIKLLRKKLGLTQSDLAARSGVSQSLIAKVESGKLDPSYTNAMKLFSTLRQLEQKSGIKARDIMNQNMITISPGSDIKHAIEVMRKHGISQLPVAEGGKVLGYVSESILLESLMSGLDKDAVVSEVMEGAPPIIPPETDTETIAALLRQYPIIIVRGKGSSMGVVTRSDLLTQAFRR